MGVRRVTRRGFLVRGGGVLGAVAGTLSGQRTLAQQADPAPHDTGNRPEEKRGRRLAMLVDLDRCVGCHACAVACKAENGVRLGGFRCWVSERETGTYPRVKRIFLPRQCNHCQEPACLKVCPVGATFKRPDGLVDIDKSRCIGCRYCMVACPYGVRYFNPRRDPQGAQLFPARTWGTVDKCNFCAHRVDHGVVPACVNTCPAKARLFGDLDDPASEVALACRESRTAALLPEYGTGPSVFYRGEGSPLELFVDGPGAISGSDPE